ncbi:reticulon-like protein B21 isoform X2 [Lycium ferocissimum]|uniref:reticulon-like protein B21 isoform X2 n=1 Tax=Lycium ferocissimum TaxID=112874 RepID=UPI0028162DC3|nr:reticulon-like protein B21 isoform X2 [Lycium ferocissimum]
MEVGNNRRRSTSSSRNNNGVVVATGSVWENRMKLDEVKGGFKVFSNNNNDETPNENDGKDCNFISGSNTQVDKKLDMGPKKTNIGVVGVSGKRKTWKTESSPIQIASKRSGLSKKLDEKCDLSKNLDEKCKDLSVSVDGVVGFTMKNGKAENFDGNQIQIASKRSDLSKNLVWRKKNLGEKCKNLDEKCKDLSVSDNGVVGITKKTWKVESFDGNQIQIASKRSDLSKNLDEKCDLSKNLDEKSKDLSVSDNGVVGITRRTWKTESFDGNQIQIASKRSDLSKNLDEKSKDLSKNLGEKCKNLSVSADGVVGTTRKTWKSESLEGNSIQIASKRSDLSKNLEEKYKDLSKFFDDKCKDLSKNLDEKCKDVSVSGDGVCKKVPNQSKKNSELRKLKSESVNGNVKKSNLDVRILKKSNLEESSENLEGSIGIKKTKSEEFGMCEEKFITSNVVSEAKSANKLEKNLENEDDNEEWDDVLEDEIDEEIEKKSVDVKEIRVQEQNKPKKIVIEEKKFQYNNKRQIPVSSINKKQSPPTLIHAKIHPSPTRTKSVPVSDEFQSRKHSKLQSLVDLVMWRNVSKSALVFGIGTFVIISSSYTQDLNISFISVLSCLGLVYLAAIFLFRSLIHRRAVDIGESSEYVVGEEEAVWILKLILPFINEFLLKIRALFSGDPSTTMKMAVLLFLLAKFGSYITIWKLSKLGFFGVFVIPKVCSSYSTQLTSYGTFLIMYIRDAWESCNHKKAVGFAIFTLVWNFSSIIARIWAVFMLYVGFRYYQQTLMREDTTIKADDFLQGKIREQRQVGRKPNSMDTRKQKKAF